MSEYESPDADADTPRMGDPHLIHGPLSEAERKEHEKEKYQNERDLKEDSYKDRQAAINERQLTTNRRIACYTLILAGLNILGFVVSLINSQIAKESANAAKSAAETATDALRIVQRPIIVPSTPTPTGLPQHMSLVWFNRGDTRTKDATYRLNAKMFAKELPAGFSFRDESDTDIKRTSISPKDSFTAISGGEVVTPARLNDVKEGTKRLYVWGWVKYRDLFANTEEHISMACFEVHVSGDPLNPGPMSSTYTFDRCTKHYCADDECDGEEYGNGQVWHAPTQK